MERSKVMQTREMSRRAMLVGGSAALAGLAMLRFVVPAQAFPVRPQEQVPPWLDQPTENPVPDVVGQQLQWEELDSWLTPNEKFFTVQHYNKPVIAEQDWHLEIGGLVQRP